jgi:hypothetical protein
VTTWNVTVSDDATGETLDNYKGAMIDDVTDEAALVVKVDGTEVGRFKPQGWSAPFLHVTFIFGDISVGAVDADGRDVTLELKPDYQKVLELVDLPQDDDDYLSWLVDKIAYVQQRAIEEQNTVLAQSLDQCLKTLAESLGSLPPERPDGWLASLKEDSPPSQQPE